MTSPAPAADPAAAFAGRRVMVVEDEAMVSMMIEDMLLDLGCAVAGPYMRVADACAALADGAEDAAIDLALLDVNVAHERSFPVAEALAKKGVPFAFITGYDADGIDPAWRDRPTLRKPFGQGDFESTLRRLLPPA
jgi:CheY-like chemotaxis protein